MTNRERRRPEHDCLEPFTLVVGKEDGEDDVAIFREDVDDERMAEQWIKSDTVIQAGEWR